MSDMTETEEAVARAIELANENNMQVVSFKSAKWHREAQAAIATLQSQSWLPPEAAKAMRNEVREAAAKAISEMVFSSTRRAGDLIQDQCAAAIRAMKEPT